MKKAALGGGRIYSCRNDANNQFDFRFGASDNLYIANTTGGTGDLYYLTTATFRDVGSWYHFLLAVDTTQATAGNRVKLYVNGVQITDFQAGAVVPAQNLNTFANTAYLTTICGIISTAGTDGYLADLYMVDGVQQAATDFGQANPLNPSVWIPKTPTGLTYGTNGFHLDFADAATLGNDISGNNNDYTSSGLTSADQMLDTPTNTACVLNALTGSGALSEGNLKMATGERFGTFGLSSGKWSWKFASTSTQANGIEKADGTESTVAGVNGKTDEFLLDLDAGTLDYVRDGSTTSIATGLSGTFFPLFKAAGTAQFVGYTPATGHKLIDADNFASPPAIATSGTFTGNANADGPFVYMGGTPDSLSIDSNAVTWGTHADKLANGFKIRTAAAGYNDAAANNWTAVTTLDRRFPLNNAQGNP
jgi:hypothetical protein